MTQEDKAKAYDMALDKIERLLDICDNCSRKELEHVFPELKKFEGERIRKSLIDYLHTLPNHFSHNGGLVTDWIAWLEEQGEQECTYQLNNLKSKVKFPFEAKVKSSGAIVTIHGGQLSPDGKEWIKYQSDAKDKYNVYEPNNLELVYEIEQKSDDKAEPKFKAGDYVVNNNGEPQFYQVIARSWPDSKIKGVNDNFESFINTATLDNQYHLWTIQDAKDGDVLVDSCADFKNPLIFILKKFEHKDFGLAKLSDYSSYCFLTMNNKQDFKEGSYHHMHNIHPATKEQRDTLMKAMADAGYEWDAEHKQLRKIEQKPVEPQQNMLSQEQYAKVVDECIYGEQKTNPCDGCINRKGCINCENGELKETEQKPAWSEEDEKMFRGLIAICDEWTTRHSFYPIENCEIEKLKNWLKSLKERVQLQPKQEWSKEERQIIEDAACVILSCVNTAETKKEEEELEKLADKLQDLRPQSHWKPSDEQMKALEIAIRRGIQLGTWEEEALKSLKEQLFKLKKLRKE